MAAEKAGVTEEIADFIAGTRYEDYPSEVLRIAKRCITDGIGVILAGSTEPCIRILKDYVLSSPCNKESTFLGKGKGQTAVRFAALVNGTAGHAMDWDDTAISSVPDRGTLLHPTMPPLAAGLAVGENRGVSGRDLLVAFLTGVEVECKLTEAISADHRVRGFHTSGTCGIFGAAAAAAKLMNVSGEKIKMMLGIAASMSAGLDVNLGSMVKPLHVGRAAENGIMAAQLASRGYEANSNALEGYKGFFQAFGGGFDPDRISGKLGCPSSLLDPGVSVKRYPCGVVGQGTMEAMRILVIQQNLKPEEIAHIRVLAGLTILPPKGPLRFKKAQNALQAKFSVPFQMASIVIRRKAGIREFTDEFVLSSGVQEMMERVETMVEPEFDAYGRNRHVSVIEVQLKDGKVLNAKSPDYIPGSPRNPLSPEDLAEKFRDCVQEVLTAEQTEKLLETIGKLEDLGDIGTLINRACTE